MITTAADRAQCVYAADLDGDGDADVLSASAFFPQNLVAWYENLGGGVFGPPRVITTDASGAASVFATDLDGDGDADVLSASELDDKVAWYENSGDGTFGPQQVISATADGAGSLHAADLDGDGDADVVAGGTPLAWYENLGGGAFGPQRVITTKFTVSVHASDLDEDGDADVLSAYSLFPDNLVAWYENLGGGAFGPEQVFPTTNSFVSCVYASDLDGDGDADVLSATFDDDRIGWYENLGGGVFGPQQVITNDADGASSVHAIDLDGDGDADVLSASRGDDKIAWYENLGSGSFGPQQVISTAANGPVSVHAADLDGDGSADVLSASEDDDKIAWYENLLPGPEPCASATLLGFETEDDQSTLLVNGQDIATPPEFGELVSIHGSGVNYGAAIFDSDPAGPNAAGPDPDLLIDQGNILILQETPWQSMPGVFDVPNDSRWSGTLHFEFLEPVELLSIDLVDIDVPDQDCEVVLLTPGGATRTYFVPSGWTSDVFEDGGTGVGTLDLTTLAAQAGFGATATASEGADFDPTNVVEMDVHLVGSGGVDNLRWCSEAGAVAPTAPAVEAYGCEVNAEGSLSLVSGAPVLGSTLVLGIDNPIGTQAPGALPFLLVASAPDAHYPCGTLLPGAGMSSPYTGELLVQLAPLLVLSGAAWEGAGTPALVSVVVPDNPALLGRPFHAQGVLLDATPGAMLPIALTGALRLTVGSN